MVAKVKSNCTCCGGGFEVRKIRVGEAVYTSLDAVLGQQRQIDHQSFTSPSVHFERTSEVIAACLVQPYQAFASIRFAVTHPHFQSRGIGRQLMEYAIHTVAETFEFVALAVTIGNPAHGLYHRMGFVQGPMTHTLKRT